MKFITLNNLNENLQDYFEYIVKPYIKSEKAEFPWRNKKRLLSRPEGTNNEAIVGLYNCDDELVIAYRNADNTTRFYKSNGDENFNIVNSDLNTATTPLITPIEIFKYGDNKYFVEALATTAKANQYSTDGLKTIQNIPTTILPENVQKMSILSIIKAYIFTKLKNGKVITANTGTNANLSGIYLQEANGNFTKVFANSYVICYYSGEDYVYSLSTENQNSVDVYRANIDDLNFTKTVSVPKATNATILNYKYVGDDIFHIVTGVVNISVDPGTAVSTTTYSDVKEYLVNASNNNPSAVEIPITFGSDYYSGIFLSKKSKRIFFYKNINNVKTFYYSDDYGKTWNRPSDIPASQTVMWIEVMDNGDILVLADAGVYISHGDGEHFELKLEGSYVKMLKFKNQILLADNNNVDKIEFF